VSRAIDRRTVLAAAAGALLGVALKWPSQAGARAASFESLADVPFDPVLARRLQQVLDDTVAASKGTIPGAILHVERADHGSFSGAAGLARVQPPLAIRPGDRFRAGSIVKPFIAATVLQLVERGRLSLEATLPELLPAAVAGRFPTAPGITLRMLLSHRSGLPDWSTDATDATAARAPARVWKVSEFLDMAAAKPPMFKPGARYTYSNTNYTVVALIIEQATGRSWRREVTEGVIRPLRLRATSLPAPGNRSWTGPYAHGYMRLNGKLVDTSGVDPSMAGAAGGHALITTTSDLVRFFDALLAGRLFRQHATLQTMLAFRPASGEPGQVGYGLGLVQRVFPGGIKTIDHLGGAGGYYSYVARLPRQQATLAAAINVTADPAPFLVGVLQVLASAHR
jgi:D-alanyl-D-alanine carboxypeptidase